MSAPDTGGEALERLSETIGMAVRDRAGATAVLRAMKSLLEGHEIPSTVWRDLLRFTDHLPWTADAAGLSYEASRCAGHLLVQSNGVEKFVDALLHTREISTRDSGGESTIDKGLTVLRNALDQWEGRQALARCRAHLEEIAQTYPGQREVLHILGSIAGGDRSAANGMVNDWVGARRSGAPTDFARDAEFGRALERVGDLGTANLEDIRFLLTDERGGWPVYVLRGLLAAPIERLVELQDALRAARGRYGMVESARRLLDDLEGAISKHATHG